MTVSTLNGLVDSLESHRDLSSQLVHRAYLPGQPNAFAELDPPLPLELREALAQLGIERLWSHQIEGIAAARRGENVLITTPTASGKSLVFQLPILESMLAGEPGRALFLYPLKALGRDQRSHFLELARAAGLGNAGDGDGSLCEIYDGDTPRKAREKIRKEPPRVLISNPDMLHIGLLGNAAQWTELFRTLRFIVLDELHTYRGVFGTHFHHVLQRLLRQCRRHGSEPVVIASSATATNAAGFAERLADRPFTCIETSGAAREGRHFLLYQPSTSPYTTTLQLFTSLLDAGLKTIVFTKARRITELLHQWLGQQKPELKSRVANYRAGFLADERRQIERDLFEGRLDGVISTSALEMGIDVGGLDACILVGYPGSMMATWQRSGRVGREGRESVTALVALPDALDQYLLANPDEFLNQTCEPLVVSAGNDAIAGAHLLCAAAELPLSKQHDRPYLERHAPVVGDLLRQFQLAESEDGRELLCLAKSPHRGISLRGGGRTFQIVSSVSGRTIGTVDGARVQRECHPGAIYLHAGRQFLIVELDLEKRQALAEPTRVDYFTSPLTEKETTILELLGKRKEGSLHCWIGRVRVTEWVVGYERKKIFGQEKLGQEELELPPVEFETVALWFAAPRSFEETLRERSEDFMGALHASEHAAISLFPVLALCDRNDLGGISIPHHPQVGCGAVFVYDGHEGGVGIAEAGFERLPELLDRVDDLLASCSCEAGCPSCIQSPKCGNGNRPLDKQGAARLIRLLRDRESPIDFEGALADQIPEPRVEPEDRSGSIQEPETDSVGVFRLSPEGRPAPVAAGRGRHDLFNLEAPVPTERPSTKPVSRRPAATAPPPAVGEEPAAEAGPTAPRRARRSHRRQAPRGRSGPPRRTPPPRVVDHTVLFDVETRRSAEEVGGWHNLHRLGVAIAVTCHLEEGRFHTYTEAQVPELVAELESADLVVGFNVVRFDYPVLSGYTGVDYRRTLPTLDLFEDVQRTISGRLGLAHLAQATLGEDKSADGLQSLEWYKQGRLDLIEEYCKHDVEILRDLYLFGRREGYVCCRTNRAAAAGAEPSQSKVTDEGEPELETVRIPVDWP